MTPQEESAETKLSQGLVALDIPTASFAALYKKRSGSYINQALSGVTRLKDGEAYEMLALLQELRELADSVAPLPVNFRNASIIGPILEERRAARRATLPKAFQVFINGLGDVRGYFAGQNRFGKPLAELFSGRAQFMTSEVADELVAKLTKFGINGARKVSAQPTDTVVYEQLADVWLEGVSNGSES